MIRRIAGILRRPPQPAEPSPAAAPKPTPAPAPQPAPAAVNGGQGIPVNPPPRALPPIPVPATNPAPSDNPPAELITDTQWHIQEHAILDQLAYETDRTDPLAATRKIFGGPQTEQPEGEG